MCISNKIKLKKCIVFILVFSMAVAPMLIFRQSIDVGASTTIEQDKSAVANMNRQIALKKQQIAQAEKEIAALRNNQSSYAALKTKLDEKIGIIQETVEMYNEMLSLQAEEMIELEKEIEETQAKYDIRYADFLEMMRLTYEESNTSYIEIIVKSENLSDFLSRVDIISELLEYNKNILDDLKKAKEDNLRIIAAYEIANSENLKYQEELQSHIQDAREESKEADRAIAAIQRDLQQKINLHETITRDMNNTQ